jgi:hypothetical protein
MPTCLFCDNDLHSKTRPEHILLNALGGRKTSRRIVCSGCNEYFGSTIDKDLAESVSGLRNVLQHTSGSGNPPPSRSYESQSGKVTVDPNGSPSVRAKPFEVRRDGSDVQLTIQARDKAGFAKHLRHAAAQLRCSPIELLDQLRADYPCGLREEFQPAPPDQGRLSVGGDQSLRSVAKSCVELLALAVGNDAVRSEPYTATRKFVREGDPHFNDSKICLDTRPLPIEASLRDEFGAAFHLVWVKSNAVGRTLGYFRLYGFAAWTLVLAEAGDAQLVDVNLVCDPVSGKWADNLEVLKEVPFVWLEQPEFDGNNAALRLQSVHELAHQRSFELFAERMVNEEFARHGFVDGVISGDDKNKEQVIGNIVARAASALARLPFQRTSDWDEVEKLLKD